MTYQSQKSSSGSNAGGAASASRGPSSAALGVPRFLSARGKMTMRPTRDQHAEVDADRAGARMLAGGVRNAPEVTPIGRRPGADRLGGWLARQASSAEPLPSEWSGPQDVRIHSGSSAGRIATSMGANAVTVGKDIFFAPGRYAPGTPGGDRLLAHELAHVAQQGGEPRAL